MCVIFIFVPYFPFIQRSSLFWATNLHGPHNFLPVLTCLNVVFLSPDFNCYLWNLMFQSLASQVRKQLHESRMEGKPVEGFNHSTSSLLARYLAVRSSHYGHFIIKSLKLFNMTISKVKLGALKLRFLFVGPPTHPI